MPPKFDPTEIKIGRSEINRVSEIIPKISLLLFGTFLSLKFYILPAVNKILHSKQFLVICNHWKFETFGNYLNLFNFMQDDAIQAFTFWRQILSSLSSSEMTMIKSDVGINIVIFSLSAMRWWGNWSDLCSGPQGRTVGSVAQEGRWRHCQGHSGLEGPQSHLQTHHPGTIFGCQKWHFISKNTILAATNIPFELPRITFDFQRYTIPLPIP